MSPQRCPPSLRRLGSHDPVDDDAYQEGVSYNQPEERSEGEGETEVESIQREEDIVQIGRPAPPTDKI